MKNTKFELYGFVKGLSETGFCIPIFQNEAKDGLYFQDISKEETDEVSGFSRVDKGYNQKEIRKIGEPKKGLAHKTGDNPIFGFQFSINLHAKKESILIFDTRLNLFKFFQSLLKDKLITDKYLIKEIYHLYKDNVNLLEVLKSYNEPQSGFGVVVTVSNDNKNRPGILVAEPMSHLKMDELLEKL